MISISTSVKSIASKMILTKFRMNSPKPESDSEEPKIMKSNMIYSTDKIPPFSVILIERKKNALISNPKMKP